MTPFDPDTEMGSYTGQYIANDWWYRCDICGRVVPWRQTTRKVLTQAQQGYRVCRRCLDQPGTDDMRRSTEHKIAAAAREDGKTRPP